jgi:tetratricopeptide (TPR) repeat protein
MKFVRFFTLIFISLNFFCAGPNQEVVKKAGGHRDLGISYLNEGNLSAAMKELQEAEKLYADDPELQNALGSVYHTKGIQPDYPCERIDNKIIDISMINNAEIHYKKAIKLNDNYSEAHNNLGVLYLNMERYDDAINEFNSALKNMSYSTPERAYVNMGWAYYKKKNYKDAELNLKRAIQSAPDFFIAHYNLGLLYRDRGNYKEAIKEFKLAIKYFPKYVDAYYDLAHTYLKIKRADYALSMFQKVCELAPGSKCCERSAQYIEMLKK